MRILLLNDRIPPESRGGAGAVFWRLALALQADGHDVHVIAATEKDSFEATRDGIPTYHIHAHYRERWRGWLSLYNPQTATPLRDLYQRIQPDVINAHNIHADLTYHSLTIAHAMAIPTVFSSHDVMPFAYHKMSYFIDPTVNGVASPQAYRLPPLFNLKQMRLRYNPFRNLRIRHVLSQHTHARTAPSQELANAHGANDLPPFEVVHNGIDARVWQVDLSVVEALRQRLNLQGRKVILFAGRLTAAKGTAQLLDALQHVVQQVPNVTLLVLSSQSIEAQVQQPEYANLREQHMVSGGWMSGDDLVAAYQLADVVTVPSIIFDTFPTVNLEAMATQTPVVATCYGGSHEAVVDGETGYIINPFDTLTFADRLTRLLIDDGLRQQMGNAGYARVREQFSIEKHCQQMLDLYRRVQS